jgi:cytoskeletal protein CcmA (bactofilin family)
VSELDSTGAPCAIGPDARFEGLLSFWGEARVEGTLHGEVAARGTLEVGATGRVTARIEVDSLVVEGEVEGEIVAHERVEVMPGAVVRAAIRTPRLSVADGARFEGRLEMAGTAPGGSGPDASTASAA